MTSMLLELKDVHTHIGAYHILHGVNLQIPRGELTLLLGRNGAGKTTTLRTIMGLWQASKGEIHFNGHNITQMHTPDIASLNIAYVPENMGIFSDLTVEENMLLAARQSSRASQMDRDRLNWIYAMFPAVEKFWHHPAGKLSGGQKQMLAVARAMVEPRDLLIVDEPSKGLAPAIVQNMIDAFQKQMLAVARAMVEPRDLLIVDEPSKGLAPAIVQNMIDAFQKMKASGVTILLVEQNIHFAQQLGDSVAVMDNGRVIHAGRMAALSADLALQQSLLGLAL